MGPVFLFLSTKTSCPVIWYEISATGSAVVITIEVAALIVTPTIIDLYTSSTVYWRENVRDTLRYIITSNIMVYLKNDS